MALRALAVAAQFHLRPVALSGYYLHPTRIHCVWAFVGSVHPSGRPNLFITGSAWPHSLAAVTDHATPPTAAATTTNWLATLCVPSRERRNRWCNMRLHTCQAEARFGHPWEMEHGGKAHLNAFLCLWLARTEERNKIQTLEFGQRGYNPQVLLLLEHGETDWDAILRMLCAVEWAFSFFSRLLSFFFFVRVCNVRVESLRLLTRTTHRSSNLFETLKIAPFKPQKCWTGPLRGVAAENEINKRWSWQSNFSFLAPHSSFVSV